MNDDGCLPIMLFAVVIFMFAGWLGYKISPVPGRHFDKAVVACAPHKVDWVSHTQFQCSNGATFVITDAK